MNDSQRLRRAGWVVSAVVLAGWCNLAGSRIDAAESIPADEEPATAAAGEESGEATAGAGASAGPTAPLPWNRSAARSLDPPAPRLSSAREMLNLFNVDESELAQLQDGRPLVADEEETLWKILYNLPRFGWDKLHAWRQTGIAWDEVASSPDRHRIEVFGLEGRVQGLRRVELPPESAERLELTHYFEADFVLQDAANQVLVCCRDVPEAWQTKTQLDERAACLGLFLKSGSTDDAPVSMVFATERIAWMPDRVEPESGIGADEVLLGNLGVDVGLIDGVRRTNGRGMLTADRELFYQMLAAAGRLGHEAAFEQAANQFDLAVLLNDPARLQGRLVSFYATAIRTQKILVDDPDIQERFGITHYYQIDLQVPLGDQEIRLVTKPGETDGPVFRNTYPAHCNVLELPPGLSDQPDVNQQVQIAGFYLKLWAYQTEYVKSFGREKRQLAPLFIAVTPRAVERANKTNSLWGWIGGGVFLAALAGIALASWIFRRSDRRFQNTMRRRQAELASGSSLDRLGPEVGNGPDFSHLDQDRGL